MLIIRKIKDVQKRTLVLLTVLAAVQLLLSVTLSERITLGVGVGALASFIVGAFILFAYEVICTDITRREGIIRICVGVLASVVLSFGANLLYCAAMAVDAFGKDSFVRLILFSLIFFVACAYVLYDASSVSDFIHKKRWIIAGCVFLLFVALKLNFSNAACFHYYIQPDSATDFTVPIIGVPRDIRSDEWLVDTPRRATGFYTGYGLINDIIRGTENYNISGSYLYLAYSALSNPFYLGYYLLGVEYGASFHWCGMMIASIMVAYEFSLVITGGNKRLSLLGAALLGLSSFGLWWSINAHILAVGALIVCAYHFFRADKTANKILLAAGVAFSGIYFICTLYPAWQVPLAYILLAMFAWVIVVNFEKVKAMRLKDWAIVGGAFLFMCSVVVAYFYDSAAYSEAVMQTVYPGQRFDSGGDAFYKGSWYVQTLLYPFINTGNNSEAGTFFSLFPLPMIMASVTLIAQIVRKIKNKTEKVDYLLALLLIPTLLLMAYCTTGVPEWLAKITLMNYSIPLRAIDMLCLANVYFLIRLLSYEDKRKLSLPVWAGLVISLILAVYNMNTTQNMYPTYMSYAYVALVTVLIVAVGTVLLCRVGKVVRKTIISVFTLIIVVCGVATLPITRGYDALFEKPASAAVQDIVERDGEAKWIGYASIVTPQFLIANGARTVNSVNYIPNMELWGELDPQGVYNDVYNRYSHVNLTFTDADTSFTLIQPDLISVDINYADIEKIGAKYVFAQGVIEENSEVIDFKLLYNESNVFIYEIIYN